MAALEAGLGKERGELCRDGVETLLAPAHEVHLVHADDQFAEAEPRGNEGMAPGLFGGAARRIDEEQCCVCGAGAGDHVAGVLEVAGCVGDDELAPLGREVAVGHIDGDLLLALGEESVCEEREVEVWRAVRPEYGGVGELVVEEGAGVEEEPAQEG